MRISIRECLREWILPGHCRLFSSSSRLIIGCAWSFNHAFKCCCLKIEHLETATTSHTPSLISMFIPRLTPLSPLLLSQY
mmetsp:Transcript_50396/g.129817  ORF Transcript_50396/g.129817 Transcript_50396/m.129817 type:complete len:80 (+) Transcript_50396:343-582(+)